MAKAKQPHTHTQGNLPLVFDATCSPSARALNEAILRKKEEVRVGQLDFDRWRPNMREIEAAAATKNHNRAKVDGEWYDVRLCKALSHFMNDWRRRRSQLEWEITELEKELARI